MARNNEFRNENYLSYVVSITVLYVCLSKILMEAFCAATFDPEFLTVQPDGQNVKTSEQDILADELERKIAWRLCRT